MKKFNLKLKTHPVCDYAEKAEMEALFLACVGVSKQQLQKRALFENNFKGFVQIQADN